MCEKEQFENGFKNETHDGHNGMSGNNSPRIHGDFVHERLFVHSHTRIATHCPVARFEREHHDGVWKLFVQQYEDKHKLARSKNRKLPKVDVLDVSEDGGER